MRIDIRVFEPEDHAQARGLWDSTEGVGLSDADSFENVRRFLERNAGLSFVAIDDHQVVATILCGHDGRRGLIHHLAVAASHHRRGLGRVLVRRALAGLKQEGIQKCHLLGGLLGEQPCRLRYQGQQLSIGCADQVRSRSDND